MTTKEQREDRLSWVYNLLKEIGWSEPMATSILLAEALDRGYRMSKSTFASDLHKLRKAGDVKCHDLGPDYGKGWTIKEIS
jgi:hypothetical protein